MNQQKSDMIHNCYNSLKSEYKRLANIKNKIYFYNRCLTEGLVPKFIDRLINCKSLNTFKYNVQNKTKLDRHSEIYKIKMLQLERKNTHRLEQVIYSGIKDKWRVLNKLIDNYEFQDLNEKLENIYSKEYERCRWSYNKKLKFLRKDKINEFLKIDVKNDKFVENLSKVDIPEDVIRGLCLGPKFGFIDQKEKTVFNILGDVENYISNIKNTKQQSICRNKVNNCILNYINKKNNFNKFKKVDQIIATQIKAAKKYKKQMEEKLVFLSSDKSNSIVIMDKEDYKQKALEVLNDDKKYIKLCNNKDPVGKAERKVNQFVKKIYENNGLTKGEYQQLLSKNANAGMMYFLAKSHKENCPLRPVITNYQTPSENLSKYLGLVLKNIVNGEHRVKNSNQVLERIKNIVLDNNETLVSYDVKNLYPSLPLEIIKKRIKDHWEELNKFTVWSLEQIIQALELCLDVNIFNFEGQLYKQVSGCPIGSNISPVLADIFIDYVHEEVFSKVDAKLTLYYVDDSLVVVDKTRIDDIWNKLNNLHQNIEYTYELEKNNAINFLDITLIRCQPGLLKSNIFTKPQKSARSINYYSHHPEHQKVNIIKNEYDRMKRISDKIFIDNNERMLKEKFIKNGYPENFLKEIIVEKSPKNNVNNNQNKQERKENLKIIGSITYVPGLSEIIKSILKMFKINITYKINKPLNNITNNKFKSDKMEKSGVVYSIPCASCGKNGQSSRYIGETGRKLKIRMKEHFYTVAKSLPKTALSIHALECKHEFDWENVEILYEEQSVFKRRFFESAFINFYDDESINLKTEREKSSLVYAEVLSKIKKQIVKEEKNEGKTDTINR